MVRSAVDNPAGKEENENCRHETAQKKNEEVVVDENEAAQSDCTRTPRPKANTVEDQQPGPSDVNSHGPQRTVFKKASQEILIEEISASSSLELESLETTVIVEEPDDDTHSAPPGSSEGEELVITPIHEELSFEGTGTDETELGYSDTVVFNSSNEGIEPIVTDPRTSEQNDLPSLECKTVKPNHNIPDSPKGSGEEKVDGDINESRKPESISQSAQNDLASLEGKTVNPNHITHSLEETILPETDETVNLHAKPRLEEDWCPQETDIFSPVANSTIINHLPKEKRLKIQICPNCEVFHKDGVCPINEQDISKWKNNAFIAVNKTCTEVGSSPLERGSGDYLTYLSTLGSPLRNELNVEVITTPYQGGGGEAEYTRQEESDEYQLNELIHPVIVLTQILNEPNPTEEEVRNLLNKIHPKNENTFNLSAALMEPDSVVGITLTPEEVRVVKKIQDKKEPELKSKGVSKNTWLGRILKITLIAGCGWAAFKLARAFLSRRK